MSWTDLRVVDEKEDEKVWLKRRLGFTVWLLECVKIVLWGQTSTV